jgi:hypothetical protein
LGYTARTGGKSVAIFHSINEVVERSQYLSKEFDETIEPDLMFFIKTRKFGIADTHEWTYLRKDTTFLHINEYQRRNNWLLSNSEGYQRKRKQKLI